MMEIHEVDPWLGDTVCGPDNVQGLVVGVGTEPSGAHFVTVRLEDRTLVRWKESDCVVTVLCETVPLDRRVGRSQ